MSEAAPPKSLDNRVRSVERHTQAILFLSALNFFANAAIIAIALLAAAI